MAGAEFRWFGCGGAGSVTVMVKVVATVAFPSLAVAVTG